MAILQASQNDSFGSPSLHEGDRPADLGLAFSAVYCIRYQFDISDEFSHAVCKFRFM